MEVDTPLLTDRTDVKFTCHQCWMTLSNGQERFGGYRCVGTNRRDLALLCSHCEKPVGALKAFRWERVIRFAAVDPQPGDRVHYRPHPGHNRDLLERKFHLGVVLSDERPERDRLVVAFDEDWDEGRLAHARTFRVASRWLDVLDRS